MDNHGDFIDPFPIVEFVQDLHCLRDAMATGELADTPLIYWIITSRYVYSYDLYVL